MLNFIGKDNFVWWTGVVEDFEKDPLKIGRVKVRIFGFYDEGIETEDLPWALPIMPITSASVGGIGQSPTGVRTDSWVIGFFRDGEYAQEPIIWGTLPGTKGSQGEGINRNGRGEEVPQTLRNYSKDVANGGTGQGTGVVPSGQKVSQISDTTFNDAASKDLVSFLKAKEGYSSKSYWDHKQHSIGYGTKANYPGEVIDEQEAEARLSQNIAKYRGYVLEKEKQYGYTWNERQRDALTSFAYNLGPGGLDQLTNNGTRDNETIANKMLLYNKASGQTIDALATRRQEERAMFLSDPTGTPAAALSPDDVIDQRNQRSMNSISNEISQSVNTNNQSGNRTVNSTNSSQTPTQTADSDLPTRCGLPDEPQSECSETKNELVSNSKFTEPESPYAAVYPYNQAIRTPTGHVLEIDDTPGAERIHTYHRSGSFEEYHPDGKKVSKTVGDGFDLVMGNKNLHVGGNLTIVVEGNFNLVVGKKSTTGVGGKIDITSGGNHTIKAPKIDLNP